ncbi:MAG: hypothetical protein Q9220_004362 [cf. Caloplaca sp. 1 TL-2023]
MEKSQSMELMQFEHVKPPNLDSSKAQASWIATPWRIATEVTLTAAAQDRFRAAILISQCPSITDKDLKDKTGIFDECFKPYCRLIEERFKSINESHFAPCHAAPELAGSPPKMLNLVVMYDFLTLIVRLCASKDQLTLQEVIDEQHGKGFFEADFPGTRSLLTQLMFMTLGWVTMLYDPETDPSLDELALSRLTRVSRRPFNTEALLYYEQNFGLVQQPLSVLLRGFGSVIPQSNGNGPDLGYLLSSPITMGPPASSEYLMLSYLSYSTLSRVAQIKIEWVDCLNLHLEFDEGRRLLKLFRFPSFCRLAYPAKGKRTFLHRILAGRNPDPEPHEFFRDVLLSYRLLFGQNRGSWKAFNKLYADADGVTKSGEVLHDPLLRRLCGQKWEKERSFYKDIDANEAPSHYRAEDFPFLGSRLLRLQNFSKHQEPHDWKVLWFDRRDIMKCYTFWAVLFFGGGTLIITLVQLIAQTILSSLQLQASIEQNRLQRLSIPSG